MSLGEFSESILRLLDIAAEVNSKRINEDDIKGKVTELKIDSEEDMILYAYYIADSIAAN
jgi:hypothetical protein